MARDFSTSIPFNMSAKAIDYDFPPSADSAEKLACVIESYTNQRRRRTLSLLSVSSSRSNKSSFEPGKATPAVVVTIRQGHDALGSFTPTNSATASLRSIAGLTSSPFIYDHRRRPRVQSVWNTDSLDYYDDPPTTPPDSPLSSHSSTQSIPSISRTSSSFFTTSSGHSSPASSSSSVSAPKSRHEDETACVQELHPILAQLERKSKLCRKACCSSCRKSGTDFPRCGKCGEMWCSRECRLLANGNKKHVCSSFGNRPAF